MARSGKRIPKVGIRRDSRLERLYDGCRWAEGAVHFPASRTEHDGSQLYIVDTRRGHIRAFGVTARGTLTGGGEPGVRRAEAHHPVRLRHHVRLFDHAERDGCLTSRTISSASRGYRTVPAGANPCRR